MKIFAQLLVLFVSIFAAPCAFAHESVRQTSHNSFALSASHDEAVAPTRMAYCPSPLPMQALPPEPFAPANESRAPRITSTAAPVYKAPQQTQAAAIAKTAESLPSQSAPQQKPGLTVADASINWSPWMGQLASRWFNNLQVAEEASGVRFHTVRPAMIQFTCYADGQIGNIVLRQSSGIPYYDRLQVATLVASAPLPPFPAGTERRSLTLMQGWESHRKEAGDREFEPSAFAARFPQEKVSRWVTSQQ